MQPHSFYRIVLAALSTFLLIFGWSQLMQAQTENVLFNFPNGVQGAIPRGGVVFDRAGNLYGTTTFGGQGCNGSGCGVVFELSPSSSGWTEKILYTFSGGWDGGNPSATLVFDAAGNLYGTATVGGNLAACTGHSCGVVFKLSPQSNGTWKETVLHAFQGGTDGSFPMGTLILDSAGNLYGTTRWGGSSTGNCFPARPATGNGLKQYGSAVVMQSRPAPLKLRYKSISYSPDRDRPVAAEFALRYFAGGN